MRGSSCLHVRPSAAFLLHAACPRSEIHWRLEWIESPGTELEEPSVWGHNEQSVLSEKSIMGKFLFLIFLPTLL